MEYVDGASLYSVVQHRGPLPIPLVLGIMAEVAEAIHHAHLCGVVHRDLKPHNVVLADHPDGKIVRVLDFGMAKILRGVDESMVLSADGAIFGTPAYMAPEQCEGKPPDMRSDIYALGCVGYELLLGDPPFRGSLARMLAMQLTQPPPVPSTVDPEAGIPRELDAVILRCLEKAPASRFQTGGDLSAAVQAIPGYRPLRVSKHQG
jgi:serine/threonine-protein kinase